MTKKNMRYYTTQAIRSKGAHYNFVIGERSNGKTTAALCDILSDYYQNGRKGASSARWRRTSRATRAPHCSPAW